jgi:hypothetical protein
MIKPNHYNFQNTPIILKFFIKIIFFLKLGKVSFNDNN